MTGLPLVWGEKGAFDPDSRPAAVYAELDKAFDFRPVDVLDPATLERGRLLFLAQPQRLAPAELSALDAWIRSGGRALILADAPAAWSGPGRALRGRAGAGPARTPDPTLASPCSDPLTTYLSTG
jgi:hypothetical protein